MFEAGLGEKGIEFNELDLPAEEIREGIIEIKCIPNSQKLEPLVVTSPLMLCHRCGTSRTYIVPLQVLL